MQTDSWSIAVLVPYGSKASRLVKRTTSVTVHDAMYCLVSYYEVEDVMLGNWYSPSQTGIQHRIRPRPQLLSTIISPISTTQGG